MEHLQHFGLSDDPFANHPSLALWCATPQHEDAERRLLRGVQQGKALVLLVGAAGTGKTLLLRRALDGLPEERFEATVLMIMPGDAAPAGLLGRVARQIGVDEPSGERRALLSELYARLVVLREEGRHTVVMIDGAEGLARDSGFADLRSLLGLEHDERSLVTLVLSGPPELERAIAGDPALAQRVEIKVRLAPLDETASRAYVGHRLASAGGSAALFDDAALGALVRASGGVPRLINTLADNALFEAHVARRASVTRGDVLRAASDLGLEVDGPDFRGAASRDEAAARADAPQEARARDDVRPSRTEPPAALVAPAAVSDADALDELALDPSTAFAPEEALADVFEPPAGFTDIDTAIEDPIFEPTEPEIAAVFDARADWPGHTTPADGPPKDEEIEELFDHLMQEPR